MQGRYEDYCTLVFTTPFGPVMQSGQDLKCVVNLKNGFLEVAEDEALPNEGSARIRSLSDSEMPARRARQKESGGCATIQRLTAGDGTKVTKYQWYKPADKQGSSSDSKHQSITASSPVAKTAATLNKAKKPSGTLESPAALEKRLQASERKRDTKEETSMISPTTSPSGKVSWYSQTYEEDHLASPVFDGAAFEALHKLKVLQDNEQLKKQGPMSNKHISQLRPFIPLDHGGNVTSLGSILHAEGACKPCAFWTKDRCLKKDSCLHCHFAHDNSSPAKQSKAKYVPPAMRKSGYQQGKSTTS